jgi:hypothetical protein
MEFNELVKLENILDSMGSVKKLKLLVLVGTDLYLVEEVMVQRFCQNHSLKKAEKMVKK